MQVLTQQFWVGPEILLFQSASSGDAASGPWAKPSGSALNIPQEKEANVIPVSAG